MEYPMERHIMWKPCNEPGLEHLHLIHTPNGLIADSMMIGVSDQGPFRVRYEIHCDAQYHVYCVELHLLSGTRQSLALRSNGEGQWSDACGTLLPDLHDCLDVDISVTPFTNTLAIRRLGLQPGKSAELRVAYIAVPDMRLEVVQQCYTCISVSDQGGAYRYEALFRNATTTLSVDGDSLVRHYPDRFQCVWAG